jgi:hypothetical protein
MGDMSKNTPGVRDALPATCTGCGRSGLDNGGHKARWCRCKGNFGPYIAQKGVMVRWDFYNTAEDAAAAEADRAAAKAVVDEYFAARDAGADARWTPALRRRAKSSRIYRAWARRWKVASAALTTLQESCPHEHRAPPWAGRCCERCGQSPTAFATTPEGYYIAEVA